MKTRLSYGDVIERSELLVEDAETRCDLISKNLDMWKDSNNEYMVYSCKNKLLNAKKELRNQISDKKRWEKLTKPKENNIYTF